MSATNPPAASCHARVGNEKNATGGTVYVVASDSANDTTATNPRPARYGKCDVAELERERRITQPIARINAGHTR